MELVYPFRLKKIRAIFLERINRFIIKAKIKNKEVFAYLPNPGRLWELLLPGKELLVFKNKENFKLPYTVLACKENSHYILLHTHLTNKIIKKLLLENKLDFWKDYNLIKEEIKVNSSRFDFLLKNKHTGEEMILEVKTCTLFNKEIAMFPDAETKRGTKHILELSELSKRGVKGGILFVVMNPEVEYFLPDYHIDYQFSKTLLEKINNIEIKAIALKWDRTFTFVEEVKELQIPFKIWEKIEDKGAYILVFELKNKEKLKIGSLGEKIFEKGFYVYVGSALKGLTQRINRHFRKNKKLKWHVDYLILKASNLKAIPIRTFRKIECEIAKELSYISKRIIPNFGSSDCKCSSHLFYFSKNPINKEEFLKLINKYRMDKSYVFA